METWILAHPGWLAGLGLLGVAALLRRRQRVRVAVVPHAAAWRGEGRAIRAWRPEAAAYAGLALLVVALARPQWVGETAPERQPGHDLVLAIDLSTSMHAEDFGRDGRTLNRLQAVKPIIEAFVNRRPHDRIGVVAFAGRAYTFAPLTLDHAWLRRQTARLSIGAVEDGTAIGDALGVALARLAQGERHREASRLGRFVILLTDGASNRGALDPRATAALAAERGVPIFAIGAGGEGLVPMPVFDHRGQRTGTELRRAEIDDLLLRDLAEATGGLYFRATDADAIEAAFGAIDAATRREFTVPAQRTVHDTFGWLAGVGGLLLGLAAWAGGAGRREEAAA